eukprot:523045_1
MNLLLMWFGLCLSLTQGDDYYISITKVVVRVMPSRLFQINDDIRISIYYANEMIYSNHNSSFDEFWSLIYFNDITENKQIQIPSSSCQMNTEQDQPELQFYLSQIGIDGQIQYLSYSKPFTISQLEKYRVFRAPLGLQLYSHSNFKWGWILISATNYCFANQTINNEDQFSDNVTDNTNDSTNQTTIKPIISNTINTLPNDLIEDTQNPLSIDININITQTNQTIVVNEINNTSEFTDSQTNTKPSIPTQTDLETKTNTISNNHTFDLIYNTTEIGVQKDTKPPFLTTMSQTSLNDEHTMIGNNNTFMNDIETQLEELQKRLINNGSDHEMEIIIKNGTTIISISQTNTTNHTMDEFEHICDKYIDIPQSFWNGDYLQNKFLSDIQCVYVQKYNDNMNGSEIETYTNETYPNEITLILLNGTNNLSVEIIPNTNIVNTNDNCVPIVILFMR